MDFPKAVLSLFLSLHSFAAPTQESFRLVEDIEYLPTGSPRQKLDLFLRTKKVASESASLSNKKKIAAPSGLGAWRWLAKRRQKECQKTGSITLHSQNREVSWSKPQLPAK